MFSPPDYPESRLPTSYCFTAQPPHPMDGVGAILTGNQIRIPIFDGETKMMVFDTDSPILDSFVDDLIESASPVHSPSSGGSVDLDDEVPTSSSKPRPSSEYTHSSPCLHLLPPDDDEETTSKHFIFCHNVGSEGMGLCRN